MGKGNARCSNGKAAVDGIMHRARHFMTLTIDLPPDAEARLRERAAAAG